MASASLTGRSWSGRRGCIPSAAPSLKPEKPLTDLSARYAATLEQLAYWEGVLESPEFVYVIQGDEGTPIKVGYARDPRSRQATLQTGNPQELHLLIVFPGSQAAERECHRRLKSASVRGEWFFGEVADDFLASLARHCDWAIEYHRITGLLSPFTRDAERAQRRYGWRCGAFNRPLGGRWRTWDGVVNPVEVKYVDPDPVDPEERLELQRRAIRSNTTVDALLRIERNKKKLGAS